MSHPDLFPLFLGRLNSYKRVPNGLAKLWQNAQQAEDGSTGGVFLQEGGFAAWLVYALIKHGAENQQTFAGKVDCRNAITDLERSSAEDQKSLAAELAGRIEPDVREKIRVLHDRIIEMSPRPSKRHRTAGDDEFQSVTSGGLSTSTATPGRVDASRSSLDRTAQDSLDSSDTIAEDKHVLVNAPLAAIKFFPLYTSEVIKRVPDQGNENRLAAAIAMRFPNAQITNNLRCQIAIELTSNKVQHMAWELFQVHLETTEGLRYLYMPDGVKVLPNPSPTLRGGLHDKIGPVLGSEIHNAIKAYPVYQDEVLEGRDRTDCVSMVISLGASDSATIFATLGPMEGTLIKNKLFK